MRRDLERLQDVLEAIGRIQQQLTRGRQAFDSDPLLQVWVIHHWEIIGEACRALAEETRARHPEVPSAAIIGMRNILVHDYFGLNLDAVWSAADRDIPRLREQIQAIVGAEQSG